MLTSMTGSAVELLGSSLIRSSSLALSKCIFEAGWPSLEEVTTDGVMEIGDKEGDGEVVEGASGSIFG